MEKLCINCRRLEPWDLNKSTDGIIEIDGCYYMEWIVVNPEKSCCRHFKKKKVKKKVKKPVIKLKTIFKKEM